MPIAGISVRRTVIAATVLTAMFAAGSWVHAASAVSKQVSPSLSKLESINMLPFSTPSPPARTCAGHWFL